MNKDLLWQLLIYISKKKEIYLFVTHLQEGYILMKRWIVVQEIQLRHKKGTLIASLVYLLIPKLEIQ